MPKPKVWYLETLTGSDNLPIHPMMLRLFRLVKLSRVAPWSDLVFSFFPRVWGLRSSFCAGAGEGVPFCRNHLT